MLGVFRKVGWGTVGEKLLCARAFQLNANITFYAKTKLSPGPLLTEREFCVSVCLVSLCVQFPVCSFFIFSVALSLSRALPCVHVSESFPLLPARPEERAPAACQSASELPHPGSSPRMPRRRVPRSPRTEHVTFPSHIQHSRSPHPPEGRSQHVEKPEPEVSVSEPPHDVSPVRRCLVLWIFEGMLPAITPIRCGSRWATSSHDTRSA